MKKISDQLRSNSTCETDHYVAASSILKKGVENIEEIQILQRQQSRQCGLCSRISASPSQYECTKKEVSVGCCRNFIAGWVDPSEWKNIPNIQECQPDNESL